MSDPREAQPSPLPGVRFGTIVRHVDDRGAFRELWRASAYATEDRFVQANLSSSAAGVLRGLHLHERQLDRWIVASGRAFVALVDVRPMLAVTAGPEVGPRVETRVLAPDDWVEIPVGVAHGFLALEQLELVYLVTNEFDGSDELGFAWDDAAAAIPWPSLPVTPDGLPILSDRDRANPSLRDLLEGLRGR